MVMRIVMILALVFVLSGCLKKVADENVSVEPVVTEETATAVTDVAPEAQTDMQAVLENSASMEKPSLQDIQQALANAKFYEGKIDGISGPKTRKAIESFQSQNGLKADGKVGPKTWQKLKEYLVEKTK